MEGFAEYASRSLGIKLPEDYTSFMENYGKKLPEDPIGEKSWIRGLGSPEFVIGTTLAFRSTLPGFSSKRVVIGYMGTKTIIVNKAYEDIDEYLVLDAGDGSILTVDSVGVTTRIASSFEEWIIPEFLRATLREKYTSNLIAVVFDESVKAEEARLMLLELKREGFVDLEDVVVLVKDQYGTVRYHGMHEQAVKEGLLGSITGFIVGSILFNPLVGGALGLVSGAVAASLAKSGIDDQFVEDLSKNFKTGCSALFALVRKADPDRVGEAFAGFGGKVLVSSLSEEQEAAIQASLDERRETAEQLSRGSKKSTAASHVLPEHPEQ